MITMENIREAIESLYLGTCDIKVKQKTFNPQTKQQDFSEAILYAAQPCRLSYSIFDQNQNQDGAAKKRQIIKLFLAPEPVIPPGCKIEVTQNNKTEVYKASSQPAIYRNHQEIELELFDKWA